MTTDIQYSQRALYGRLCRRIDTMPVPMVTLNCAEINLELHLFLVEGKLTHLVKFRRRVSQTRSLLHTVEKGVLTME
jgi:hypothetical protein